MVESILAKFIIELDEEKSFMRAGGVSSATSELTGYRMLTKCWEMF